MIDRIELLRPADQTEAPAPQPARRFSSSPSAGAGPRPLLVLCVCAVVAFLLGFGFYGWDYYILDQAHRPFSPKHVLLKPSGRIGLRLGMLGFLTFCLVYLYPLRKHWRWLSRKGKTRNWLDYHVLLGLTGPLIISFHSSFKFNGLAGIAYWVMAALVISGIIGRYFYAQIPRTLEAAEVSLRELKTISDNFKQQLLDSGLLTSPAVLEIFHLPSPQEVDRMSLLVALAQMVKLDLVRPIQSWRLRRMLSATHVDPAELKRVMRIARQQAVISKKILFLSRARRVFHLWHVVHRPFSYTFAILVLIHVTIALLLGFY
ncbi:MAG: hypothetical protein ACE15E_12180 [Acidobacteriota bacterium]